MRRGDSTSRACKAIGLVGVREAAGPVTRGPAYAVCLSRDPARVSNRDPVAQQDDLAPLEASS